VDISQVVEGFADQMRINRKLILAQIPHSGEMGRQLEEGLRAFLRANLPEKYTIGTGHVVGLYHYPDEPKPRLDVSYQVDVVVFNRMDFVPLLSVPDYQVYPQEGVEIAIEVKAILNHKELGAAIKNIRHVKVLSFTNDTAKREHEIIGVIFAYNTTYKKSKYNSVIHNVADRADKLVKQSDLDPKWEAVDIVCVLDAGVAVRFRDRWWIYPKEQDEPLLVLWFWLQLLLQTGLEDYAGTLSPIHLPPSIP
jgi:hypothetical protein